MQFYTWCNSSAILVQFYKRCNSSAILYSGQFQCNFGTILQSVQFQCNLLNYVNTVPITFLPSLLCWNIWRRQLSADDKYPTQLEGTSENLSKFNILLKQCSKYNLKSVQYICGNKRKQKSLLTFGRRPIQYTSNRCKRRQLSCRFQK